MGLMSHFDLHMYVTAQSSFNRSEYCLLCHFEEIWFQWVTSVSHYFPLLIAFHYRNERIINGTTPIGVCMCVCACVCVCVFVFQEHLSHIGPEEFVQAFVQKDPLDGTQVNFYFEHV